jgi:hypothetical protein
MGHFYRIGMTPSCRPAVIEKKGGRRCGAVGENHRRRNPLPPWGDSCGVALRELIGGLRCLSTNVMISSRSAREAIFNARQLHKKIDKYDRRWHLRRRIDARTAGKSHEAKGNEQHSERVGQCLWTQRAAHATGTSVQARTVDRCASRVQSITYGHGAV